jgi:hypothetical protein
MLYVSLALISLGIFIFVYSIIVDAKNRRELAPPSAGADRKAGTGVPKDVHRRPDAVREEFSSGIFEKKPIYPDDKKRRAGGIAAGVRGGRGTVHEPSAGSQDTEGMDATGGPSGRAVLYEDSSRVIDYENGAAGIDLSLEGYKNIKRIGSGQFVVEKGGISFYLGKKLYRYDFKRIGEIKSGPGHIALFLDRSGPVRLFIVESGGDLIAAANEAYREHARSYS